MKATHTPAPWVRQGGRSFVTQSGTFHLSYFTDDCGNAQFPNYCELDANARLIAEAPAMFDALTEVVAEFDARNAERDPARDGLLRETGGIALARTILEKITEGAR